MLDDIKQRIVQELVPGKQITLAHIIANPDESLLKLITKNSAVSEKRYAIGVLNVTPAQTAIILADIAIKSAGVETIHLDCYEFGSLMIAGSVSQVEAAINAILDYAKNALLYETCDVTRT